jgi:hypothetical protein
MSKKIVGKKMAGTYPPYWVKKVYPTSNYCLLVEFADGNVAMYCMKHLIFGDNPGVFARLQNVDNFNKVCVLVWVVTWMIHPTDENGIADEYNCIDVCPETMHRAVVSGEPTGEWPSVWVTIEKATK